MNNLLIDIGNTEIKIGKGKSKINVSLITRFSYSKNSFQKDFENYFEFAKDSFSKVGVSILRNSNEKFLNGYFINNYKIKPVFINREQKLPIKIKYSEGLGNDRICNGVAAYKLFDSKNILIIDFGTATTYTLVINGVLIGGMISPGIKTSIESLIERTSLPEVNLVFPKQMINDNTLDNIKAGVLFQYLFAVERVITELRKKYQGLFVVATGGNSGFIARKTKLINKVDNNLVLKGINIIISQ